LSVSPAGGMETRKSVVPREVIGLERHGALERGERESRIALLHREVAAQLGRVDVRTIELSGLLRDAQGVLDPTLFRVRARLREHRVDRLPPFLAVEPAASQADLVGIGRKRHRGRELAGDALEQLVPTHAPAVRRVRLGEAFHVGQDSKADVLPAPSKCKPGFGVARVVRQHALPDRDRVLLTPLQVEALGLERENRRVVLPQELSALQRLARLLQVRTALSLDVALRGGEVDRAQVRDRRGVARIARPRTLEHSDRITVLS
jgi:hypothetical protein